MYTPQPQNSGVVIAQPPGGELHIDRVVRIHLSFSCVWVDWIYNWVLAGHSSCLNQGGACTVDSERDIRAILEVARPAAPITTDTTGAEPNQKWQHGNQKPRASSSHHSK